MELEEKGSSGLEGMRGARLPGLSKIAYLVNPKL